MRNTKIEMSHDRKALQRYLGPYEITERTIKNNYRLMELDGTKLNGIGSVAAFRILPYITRHHWFMENNKAEEDKNEDSSESDSDKESEDSD